MAYEAPGASLFAFPADADFSDVATGLYQAVAVAPAVNVPGTGQGNCAIPAYASGNTFVGILQNNPIQGEAGTICFRGISKCQCGAAWTIGQKLTVIAAGQLGPVSGSAVAIGVALETGVVGDVSTVLLQG